MSAKIYITYECTRKTFRPFLMIGVRWLDWDQGYSLARAMWPEASPLTPEIWQEARQERFRLIGDRRDAPQRWGYHRHRGRVKSSA